MDRVNSADRITSLSIAEEEELDATDGRVSEVAVEAITHVGHKVAGLAHRAIGDTPETLAMMDRLTNQVKVLGTTVLELNRALLDSQAMIRSLLADLAAKPKSK